MGKSKKEEQEHRMNQVEKELDSWGFDLSSVINSQGRDFLLAGSLSIHWGLYTSRRMCEQEGHILAAYWQLYFTVFGRISQVAGKHQQHIT